MMCRKAACVKGLWDRYCITTGVATCTPRIREFDEFSRVGIACRVSTLSFALGVSNRPSLGGLPSRQWLLGHYYGRELSTGIRHFVVHILEDLGADAMIPSQDPRWRVDGLRSNWSERHVAYAAGLGVFGLHGLIATPRGAAGRLGSLITTMAAKPSSPLGNLDPDWLRREYCIPSYGRRVKRCPARAISVDGVALVDCEAHCLKAAASRTGWEQVPDCSKCRCGVPCESGMLCP